MDRLRAPFPLASPRRLCALPPRRHSAGTARTRRTMFPRGSRAPLPQSPPRVPPHPPPDPSCRPRTHTLPTRFPRSPLSPPRHAPPEGARRAPRSPSSALRRLSPGLPQRLEQPPRPSASPPSWTAAGRSCHASRHFGRSGRSRKSVCLQRRPADLWH